MSIVRVDLRSPVQLGEPAPDFTLPAIHHEGAVSLSDYRGRSPVLVALYKGLYCPFCRRHLAHLGITREKLQVMGVETLGIVATTSERARLYFRYRPTRVPLVADPDLVVRRAYLPQAPPELGDASEHVPIRDVRQLSTYGLPEDEIKSIAQSLRADSSGAFVDPVPLGTVGGILHELDGFQRTKTDQEDINRQYAGSTPLTGQFLVDRDGVLRWANVECAREGVGGAGKFPSDEELLAAARAV